MKFAFFAEISANFEEKEWRKQKKRLLMLNYICSTLGELFKRAPVFYRRFIFPSLFQLEKVNYMRKYSFPLWKRM